jgi:hypothetical protein
MRSLLLLLIAGVFAARAEAGCCTFRKLEADPPVSLLRVCERDAAGGCGAVLFEGPLPVGGTQNVCSAAPTVVYQEAPPGELPQGFVEAVCDDADVEF